MCRCSPSVACEYARPISRAMGHAVSRGPSSSTNVFLVDREQAWQLRSVRREARDFDI